MGREFESLRAHQHFFLFVQHSRQGGSSVSNHFEVASGDQDASSGADCGPLLVAVAVKGLRDLATKTPSSIMKSTSPTAHGSP
jgi:hypothetical protein